MMAFEINVLELNGAKGAFALEFPFFGPFLMGARCRPPVSSTSTSSHRAYPPLCSRA